MPATCRWRDLTLPVGGGTPTEVSASGGKAGTTVTRKNPTTGLVNILPNSIS
ncbi:MAG: hypothetical protein WKG07_32660 [Hymenobacter sp.]